MYQIDAPLTNASGNPSRLFMTVSGTSERIRLPVLKAGVFKPMDHDLVAAAIFAPLLYMLQAAVFGWRSSSLRRTR